MCHFYIDNLKYCGTMIVTQNVINKQKEDTNMEKERLPLFVGVDTVEYDLGVSRAKAYEVIKQLNQELKEQNPRAIIVAGRVNRIWYEEACLLTGRDGR